MGRPLKLHLLQGLPSRKPSPEAGLGAQDAELPSKAGKSGSLLSPSFVFSLGTTLVTPWGQTGVAHPGERWAFANLPGLVYS